MAAWSCRSSWLAGALLVAVVVGQLPRATTSPSATTEASRPALPLPPCTDALLDRVEGHLDAETELLLDSDGEPSRLAIWHHLQVKRGLVACGIVDEEEEVSEVMVAALDRPDPAA